ncbi:MAG: dTMP kinase [Leptolyngbyaceae cyanobacterium RM2_2_4]|nr:dTMP kinase [Leptolyngbyaceae cyanobacterium SM1_4_3]NJN89593.1 dTMP kinase [Leptolyngbyaceae cyanobacterium SL_5_14]NJO52164.1 dTMP kinase [Leptolyngbyaceae cyanobacterium RM2_2_4]NJO66346.1 dTMP kinase [Leptolyngbyaceae cyanobacterium RM1_405_57]
MQGKLIVFEGVEGSGKTTQLRRSQTWLLAHSLFNCLQTQGYISHLLVTRQPGGTELGQSIRQLLLDSAQSPIQAKAELLLYAADRAQHVEELLKPQLYQGALILCDRYTDSTVAYQGYGRGLDLNLIDQLNQVATGGLDSNLTLWFDLDVEQGLARTKLRGSADRIEQDSLAFHQRVQQGFRELASANPNRIVRIDASCSEAEVSEQVQVVLQKWLMQWYPAVLLHS